MGRNRFVARQPVRIYLADSARHQLHVLEQSALPTKADDLKAHVKALADAELNVKVAEADGDWIEVKSELSNGEAQQIFCDLVKDARQGEAWKLDPEMVGVSRALQYLTGWSFTQTLADGTVVPAPITVGALRQLDRDTAREIDAALNWHEENIEAAVTARKNAQGSGTASSSTSPSPSVSAGVSSGSGA